MRSKNISRCTKIKIYHTLIRPIIYGPKRDANTQQYRIRTKMELAEIYQGPDIVKVIKSERLRWADQVARQENDRIAKLV